jgi:hypothetical protein
MPSQAHARLRGLVTMAILHPEDSAHFLPVGRRQHLEKLGLFRLLHERRSSMNPSARIDKYISALTDWRGKMLSELREIICNTDPEILEEWKWMGSPVWSLNGILAVGNAHKHKVKLTFAQGASLPDPHKTFNAGLEGNRWRAIDFFEGDKINAAALRKLVRAAIAQNNLKTTGKPKTKPVAKRQGRP